MHDTVLEGGALIVQWLGCWSSVAVYALPTCDFNALIGPRDFVETCLPWLAEQARRARWNAFCAIAGCSTAPAALRGRSAQLQPSALPLFRRAGGCPP